MKTQYKMIALFVVLGVLFACARTSQTNSKEAINYEKANLKKLKIWAEQGNPDAQIELGNRYFIGNHVKLDYPTSNRYFEMAAKQDNPKGCFHYGFAYFYGHGVPLDKAVAAKWFTLAAEGGYTVAQITLATMLYKGDGIPADFAKSYYWISLALATDPQAKSENAFNLQKQALKNLKPDQIKQIDRDLQKELEKSKTKK